jgi:hypothetical protein
LEVSRLTRRAVIALSLTFVVTLPLVTTRLYASDEVQYFSWLRSWAFDRDVDFENEYRHFYESGVVGTDLFRGTFLELRNEAGRPPNFGPVGSAVLWTPFYAVGHLVALGTGAPADGLSQPYVSAVAYGSAIYGFLAVLLSAAIANRVVGRGIGASLVVLAGTPLVFYMYVAPPMSHANSAFAVSLLLCLWLRARERWRPRDAILLGLAGGLAAMVREQDALFAAGPAVDYLRWLWRTRPAAARWAASAAAGTVAFFAAFSPQLLSYQALNGHPGPTELVTRKMSWSAPHALHVLFSPEHGLFAWTPLVVVALAGLALLALGRVRGAGVPDARWIGTLALMMFALQVYASGSVESWTVAGAFGQRRFVAVTPLLVLGLAALSSAAARWRAPARGGLAVVLALGVWWNLGLIAQFGLHRMDRQRLTLGANAWTTFVELPREAPSIAWRYLTDRSSFYQRPRQ